MMPKAHDWSVLAYEVPGSKSKPLELRRQHGYRHRSPQPVRCAI